ncbi:MAG TPA: glycosyltransferase family 2 protein [Candidatus Dormibacteraeota bacterium]|nr:glycosyltransferase family 2 protein [Candidatus Dormibacteraeota bacterium]
MDTISRTLSPSEQGLPRSSDGEAITVCCVIPAYRAAASIKNVVQTALTYAQAVVVVDDACPQGSGAIITSAYRNDPRVIVIAHSANGGVGAAMKTGIAAALECHAEIIVKIDADGQMDPSFIPAIQDAFDRDPVLAYVKGNRFFDASVVRLMPKVRLWGNAVLSLMTKAASGYWNLLDPTNGYVAFRSDALRMLDWRSFADSYFFEISILCEFGLKRFPILELEMPTIYNLAPSSLSVRRVIFEFPQRLAKLTLKRFFVQYLIFDVNIGTLYFVMGLSLTLFGFVFGLVQWINGFITHLPKPIGTVMLAVLPFMMGFQLLLSSLMYDVQISPKTRHELLMVRHNRKAK